MLCIDTDTQTPTIIQMIIIDICRSKIGFYNELLPIDPQPTSRLKGIPLQDCVMQSFTEIYLFVEQIEIYRFYSICFAKQNLENRARQRPEFLVISNLIEIYISIILNIQFQFLVRNFNKGELCEFFSQTRQRAHLLMNLNQELSVISSPKCVN